MIPQVFLSFVGGIVADAKEKKKILIIGNIIRGIAVLSLFFLYENIIALYIIAFIISTTTQFYVPAEIPFIPHLVKKRLLLSANAIFGVLLFGSVLVGYIASGVGINIFGRSNVFIFVAFLFFASTLFSAFLPKVTNKSKIYNFGKGKMARLFFFYNFVEKEFFESIVLMRKNLKVAGAFIFLGLSQIIVLILATVIPSYAESTLKVPPEDLSLFVFAPAAFGMVISALLIGSILSKIDKRILMNIGIFASGAVMIMFPLVVIQPIVSIRTATVIVALIAGFANSYIFVPAHTILQSNIPNESRSKIYGLLFASVGFIALVPLILTGIFADVFGVEVVLVGIGTVIIILGIGKVIFHRLYVREQYQ